LRLGSEPPRLREILFDVGMQPWGTPLCMALPMNEWRPETLPEPVQARRVTTQAEAEAALRVICAVFGLAVEPMRYWCIANPEMQPFIAFVRGRPAGALVMQCNQGIAGFFHVATLPEFRRHGIASSLMQCALASARAQGMAQAALTASPMAETLYHRLGFQPCGRIETWMPASRLMRELIGAV
jgi:GNAT superfamily N-acetyltransferase